MRLAAPPRPARPGAALFTEAGEDLLGYVARILVSGCAWGLRRRGTACVI